MSRRRIVLVIVILAVALALAALTSLFFLSRGAAPPPVPATEAAPAAATPPSVMEADSPKAAPKEAEIPHRPIVVRKDGAKRISCVGACAIEARCGLRDEDACVKSSCEEDVRRVNRSDFALETIGDCAAVAELPCEEACWKRGECVGDHKSDAQCVSACVRLVRERPREIYVENRCVLESACADIAACGGT